MWLLLSKVKESLKDFKEVSEDSREEIWIAISRDVE